MNYRAMISHGERHDKILYTGIRTSVYSDIGTTAEKHVLPVEHTAVKIQKAYTVKHRSFTTTIITNKACLSVQLGSRLGERGRHAN